MADILIRGVALPKYGCAGCYFKTGKYCGIIAKNENVEEYSLRAERHPDCPIHELPQHGDLIDRDEASNTIKPYCRNDVDSAVTIYDAKKLIHKVLDSAPVVVPSERREGDV